MDRYSTSPFALILPHQPQPILTFRLGSSHLYISPNNDNPSTPRRLGPPTRHPLPPWTKLPHMSSVNDNLPSPCRLGPNYPTSLLSTMIHRYLVALDQVCLYQYSGWPPSTPSTIISIPASNPICVCRFAGIPSSLPQNHIFPILCRSHFHFSPTFLLPILPSTISHSYLHKQTSFLGGFRTPYLAVLCSHYNRESLP